MPAEFFFAGFTTGRPWIKLNENYRQINVAAEEKDPGSVLNYFRKMVRLRRQCKALVYGDYQLLETPANLYAYTRSDNRSRLLVILNFSNGPAEFAPGFSFDMEKDLLISNYENTDRRNGSLLLRPYQALILEDPGGQNGRSR